MKEFTVDNFIKNIRDRNLLLAVIGSGYIGLPTAAIFADAGFQVIAVDVNPEIVNAVNNKKSPFNEPGLQELIARNVEIGRLKATSNLSQAIRISKAVIVTVPTPIDQNKNPILSFLIDVVEDLGRSLKEKMLLVISSTIPPMSMFGKVKPKLESISGLKAEDDFYLAYVPERMSPGKAIKEFIENPRLIGGIGPNSTKIASELYRTVCTKIIEADATTIEVTKLAENTFRDINIAFANQLALICEYYGVDVIKVIELANTHPRVNIHSPGAGVGGPCLPKDPYLLIQNIKFDIEHDVIMTSRRMNDYMPMHIVDLAIKALKNLGKRVDNSKIVIFGTAYKADTTDYRFSPSEIIIKKLKNLGAKVVVYDPYCQESFGAEKAKNIQEAVNDSDCIIIVTDHTMFKCMDFLGIKERMKDNPIIIDGRRVVKPSEVFFLGFKYYGVGYNPKWE